MKNIDNITRELFEESVKKFENKRTVNLTVELNRLSRKVTPYLVRYYADRSEDGKGEIKPVYRIYAELFSDIAAIAFLKGHEDIRESYLSMAKRLLKQARK